MKILLVADTHSVRYEVWQGFLKTDQSRFDTIITLGDIDALSLRQMRETFADKEIFGVLGNHDRKGNLNFYGIEDIHNKKKEVGGLTFVGLEGSVRYKDNDKYPLYTQFEIIQICKSLPYADIVISHNSPFGIHDEKDIPHIGFQGLLSYVEDKKPRIVFHGHQHKNIVSTHLDTSIVGIYGASIVDMKTLEIERVF